MPIDVVAVARAVTQTRSTTSAHKSIRGVVDEELRQAALDDVSVGVVRVTFPDSILRDLVGLGGRVEGLIEVSVTQAGRAMSLEIPKRVVAVPLLGASRVRPRLQPIARVVGIGC